MDSNRMQETSGNPDLSTFKELEVGDNFIFYVENVGPIRFQKISDNYGPRSKNAKFLALNRENFRRFRGDEVVKRTA